MAKGQPSKLRLYQDLLKCAICYDVFNEPKILSCHHYFCKECIQNHHESTQSGNMARCPICRQAFVLDNSGAKGLPPCYFINEMLERFSKEHFEEKKEKYSQRVCQALCFRNNKEVTALYACPPCGLDLCQDCSSAHQVFFEHHEIVDVKEYQIPAMVQTLKLEEESLKCHQHKEYNLSNLCMDCQAVLCQICTLKHKDHNCISIDEIKNHTLELREKLGRMKDNIERKKREIQTYKIILHTSEAKALSKLHSTHKELHEKIDRQRTQLENRLKSYSSSVQDKIAKSLDEVDIHSKSIESILELIHTLYAFDNDRCHLMYWQNINDRSNDLDVSDDLLLPSNLGSKNAIKFDAIAVDTVNIGDLTFSTEDTNFLRMNDNKLQGEVEEDLPSSSVTEQLNSNDVEEDLPSSPITEQFYSNGQNRDNQAEDGNSCYTLPRRPPPPVPQEEEKEFQDKSREMFSTLTRRPPPPVPEQALNEEDVLDESDDDYEAWDEFENLYGSPEDEYSTDFPNEIYESDSERSPQIGLTDTGISKIPRPPPPPPSINTPKQDTEDQTQTAPKEFRRLPPPVPRSISQGRNPKEVTTSFLCSISVSGGAILQNGNIALTSYDDGKVIIINSVGKKLEEFNFPKPWDIAISIKGNTELLFVSFLKTADKPARVDFFEWTFNRIPRTFTTDVISPYGMAFTLKNELCVCEKKNQEVRIFDDRGIMIRRISQPQFQCPWYIAVTDENIMLVSDFQARCVWCLNEKGYIVDKLDKSSESDPTEFHPAKCISDGKNIFISDQDGGKVRVLSKKGLFRTVIASKNTKEEQLFCPVVLLLHKYSLIVVSKHGEVVKMSVPNEDEKIRWLK